MTIEAVNQFLTKVQQDQELKAELSQAMSSKTDRQAATRVANKHGYEFNQEELSSRIEQLKSIQAKQAANEELNEEELEVVSGGILGTLAAGVATSVAGGAALEGIKKIGDDGEFFG